jgi:hypothetical protein
MDARRSSYFAPGRDDLAEPALDANRLDWDDILFVTPANDNFQVKNQLSWGASLPRLMLYLFGRTRRSIP